MKNEFKNSNKYGFNNKVEISNNMYLKNKWGIETINIIPIPEEIQINPEENQENNYIITTFTKNKFRNIFILIILFKYFYYFYEIYNRICLWVLLSYFFCYNFFFFFFDSKLYLFNRDYFLCLYSKLDENIIWECKTFLG